MRGEASAILTSGESRETLHHETHDGLEITNDHQRAFVCSEFIVAFVVI
jgi:hypothetical protein